MVIAAPDRALLAFAILLASFLPSCLGPGYGGRPVEVELRTKPEGLSVYVVSEELWARSGRALHDDFRDSRGGPNEASALRRLLDWLEPRRVRQKTSPVTCIVSSHHQVLVARDGALIDFVEFDPVAMKAPCLEMRAHE